MDARSAQRLRAELVDRLRADRLVESARVEAALRTVPRHLFLPGFTLPDAYADLPVVTKRAADGTPRSSASQPAIVARMLEQLDVQPGDNVLEVGAGTGYNAALLAALGATVTTIDIDAEVAAEARGRLPPETTVVCGDGELGYPPNAPYDRLIVTAGAGDLPPAWLDQLTPAGRIVVPLRIRGLCRSIAFDRFGDRLVSGSMEVCGFIPLRSAGPEAERSIPLHEKGQGNDVVLVASAQHPASAQTLSGVLNQPRVAVWTGVRPDRMEHLDLWLAALDGACRLFAHRGAVDAGLVAPAGALGAAAVASRTSLAYVARHPNGRELGSYAHGPDAAELAALLAAEIETWHQRGRPEARITAHPAGTPDGMLGAGPVIDTLHTRLTLTWSKSPPAGL